MVSYTRLWTAGLACLALLFALSCAGGGNPVTPSNNTGSDSPGLTSGTNPGSGGDPTAQSHEGQGAALWGIYDIVYDVGSGSFEILPIRSSQFALNVIGWLQPPSGDPSNLSVHITDKTHISEGRLDLEVSISHPFKIPRLVGFDTMGILIGNAGIPFNEDPGVMFAGPDDLRLLNFDGYTRWMNPVEFTEPGPGGYTEGFLGTKDQEWTATVNAYKYFAHGLAANDDLAEYLANENNQDDYRGCFFPDTENTRLYQLQFPMVGGAPQIRFQYAVLSHFKGARDEEGDIIQEPEISDFPPEANCEEAVLIVPDTSGSTLYYEEGTGNSGGDLIIEMTLFDWQGMEVLNGTGAFDEIESFGLDSPDGLFSASGMTIEASGAGVSHINTGPNATDIELVVEGLQPQTFGPHEILIAVYSEDPTSYGPNFGFPYPEEARLAAYTRTIVDVEKRTSGENRPPEATAIEGPLEVNCFSSDVLYTCIASDPDDDPITYQWDVVSEAERPEYPEPPSSDNTHSFDFTDEGQFPPDVYYIWCMVSDGELFVEISLVVNKSELGFIAREITADDDDTRNVKCTNTDALYTGHGESCDENIEPFYKWMRGVGEPPPEIDPMDPDWSEQTTDNTMTYSWYMTETGQWWIIYETGDGSGRWEQSPFYIVERIDTAPTDPSPPNGKTEVNCNNSAEEYVLAGGEDCDADGGEFDRQWTITATADPPTGGWVNAIDDKFTVNWSAYPIGTFYAWQRVGTEGDYALSDPLEIHRGNTPPDEPQSPQGPDTVNCTMTSALYQAGLIDDCEDDPVIRQWALGADTVPPELGWITFTGSSFTVNYSHVPSGEGFVYQRVSDNDGATWVYSGGFFVTKINTAPESPTSVAGPDLVTCHDDAALYEAGDVFDCDVGSTLQRFYQVSLNPELPMGEWTEFTGDSFTIDWSEYDTFDWYVFQRVYDGESEAISLSFPVTKSNAPPDVGPPTGPTDVDCTSIDVEYSETMVNDCDPNTILMKSWYLSTDPDEPEGGFWTDYEGSSFNINFLALLSGDYYLFLRADDGRDVGMSTPLHIVRHNTAPEKPQIPDGPTEVDCDRNPSLYDGGEIIDCDILDMHTRSHYLSTDPVTPTGGEWVDDFGTMMQVSFDGVIAEQPYYLFQKVDDGMDSSISDSLEIIYSNTPAEDPAPPSGEVEVSCANDNEEYEGGEIVDCDSWQTFTRGWAIGGTDFPPSTGWTVFEGTSFFINWSEYEEGTYYLFQRVYDGYIHSYSESRMITVGPPSLIALDPPSGPEDLVCDGAPETYDGGEYLASCPDVDIVREWAVNVFPTPPMSGWTLFDGETTFQIDPTTLGFGYVYLFQRASLDTDQETSTALMIEVHPGELGVPPAPVGATTVDCESTDEEYEMGDVTVACDGTPVDRFWQVREPNGTPVNQPQQFYGSPVTIDWTQFDPGYTYHLVQIADDGDHQTVSDPLVVDFINYEPDFLGSITGPTSVTCSDSSAEYDGGDVYDCDEGQTLVREWAWNTIDSYPVGGWELMDNRAFSVDYSSQDFGPGDIYLFQRMSDGIAMVYDPVSLHVTYVNSPPDQPSRPIGEAVIDCTNMVQMYDAGDAFDCDYNLTSREWAVGESATPPTTGWHGFLDTSFEVDWSEYGYGERYLFQRANDIEYSTVSDFAFVLVINSPPEILEFQCQEGTGPFISDGQTTGLEGLDMINLLHFDFEVYDCDGEELENYWAVTTFPTPPGYGEPEWNGPIVGDSFEVDLADFTSLAPSQLWIHFGSWDGTNLSTELWSGSLTMWQYVWLTTFSNPGDMWAEDPCVTGSGSYTWGYDDINGYLRLEMYGGSSASSVWSETVSLPAAPSHDTPAWLHSYMNPALAEGLDNVSLGFLDPDSCDDYTLDLIFGSGCDYDSPELMGSQVADDAPIWDNNWKFGISQSGFDGCDPSNLYLDWVGMWVKPS
jgi:hypothetical protein